MTNTDQKTSMPPEVEARFLAGVDLVGRSGAKDFQIRFQDDMPPTVWVAVASYQGERSGYGVGAGMHPLEALETLLESLIDGGMCTHCEKPTAFEKSLDSMPMADLFCWIQYDPELRTHRRGCEGVTPAFFVATCDQCSVRIAVPFADREDRDKWARDHTGETGHTVRMHVEAGK